MLRIVTDGTADMPPGWEKEYDLQVIPINIQFGNKTYLQGVDLSNEDFYRLVDESGKIPKTSQPTPFQFKEFYRIDCQARGYDPFHACHQQIIRDVQFGRGSGARAGREV